MAQAPKFVQLATRQLPYARHWLIAVLIILITPIVVGLIHGFFS